MGATTRLEDLGDLAWVAIAQHLGLEDLRSLRLAARALRSLVAALVKTLATVGGGLPASAWEAFPAATGLALCRRPTPASSGAAAAGLLAALLAAPGARLQMLEVLDSRLIAQADLVDALLAKFGGNPAAGASALVQLNVQRILDAQLADRLCRRLPSSLEDLQLRVACHSGATAQQPARKTLLPALQQLGQLRRLVLEMRSVGPKHVLDLAPLAACAATLLELRLSVTSGGGERLRLLDISTLAGLSRLQGLQLPDACKLVSGAVKGRQGAAAAWWQVLGGMQQLHELQAGLLDCSAEQWEQLAACWPWLRKLRLRSLAVGPVATPSLLQHLTIRRELKLVCAGAGAGSLAQLLPQLQELEGRGAGNLGSWAAALAGHPSLQALSLPSAGDAEPGIINQLQLSNYPSCSASRCTTWRIRSSTPTRCWRSWASAPACRA
jgi:hypothetical protein